MEKKPDWVPGPINYFYKIFEAQPLIANAVFSEWNMCWDRANLLTNDSRMEPVWRDLQKHCKAAEQLENIKEHWWVACKENKDFESLCSPLVAFLLAATADLQPHFGESLSLKKLSEIKEKAQIAANNLESFFGFYTDIQKMGSAGKKIINSSLHPYNSLNLNVFTSFFSNSEHEYKGKGLEYFWNLVPSMIELLEKVSMNIEAREELIPARGVRGEERQIPVLSREIGRCMDVFFERPLHRRVTDTIETITGFAVDENRVIKCRKKKN